MLPAAASFNICLVTVIICITCADLTAAEAHHLLMLLHEWDLAGTGRHSLTDVYVCLQLLSLVRVPAGALPRHGTAGSSGLMLPERPDSRQSNATTSSITTSTFAAGKGTAGTAPQLPAAAVQPQQKKPAKRGAIGAAGEGLQGGGASAGAVSKGGLSLKEAYLKERVAALEAELTHARSGSGAISSREVSRGVVVLEMLGICAGRSHSRRNHSTVAFAEYYVLVKPGQQVAWPVCCWPSCVVGCRDRQLWPVNACAG
jgi:hypothetical protein